MTHHITYIAEKVFSKESDKCHRNIITMLLAGKNVMGATEHILNRVDDLYLKGQIGFEDAAAYYTVLDVPLPRLTQFPQRNRSAR